MSSSDKEHSYSVGPFGALRDSFLTVDAVIAGFPGRGPLFIEYSEKIVARTWGHQMKLAIMQPYFLPYLGYFHLLDAVDTFVVLDTVKYPNGGWVNRNRVLIQGRESWLTVPVRSEGQNICDKSYDLSAGYFKKLRSTIWHAYPRGERLESFLDVISEWQRSGMSRVSEVNVFFIFEFLTRLGRNRPEFLAANSFDVGKLVGQQRVLEIVRSSGASQYINLSGGEALYDSAAFKDAGVELLFVHSNFLPYSQRSDSFVQRLSTLDFFLNEYAAPDAWFGSDAYELRPSSSRSKK